jgi:hypothetical protein
VTSTPARRLGLAALALAVVLLGAACGGEEDPEARARCLTRAYNAAEAAVVAEYYAQGRLGSRESVHEALDQPGMRFFDEQDRMIPYEQLSPDEQSVLVLWFSHDRVGRITETAREQAVEQADPGC